MSRMAATASKKFLKNSNRDVNDNDKASISIVSSGYKKLYMKHPLIGLKWDNPEKDHDCNLLDGYSDTAEAIDQSDKGTDIKHPLFVGERLTTSLLSSEESLVEFELDDGNFPEKGIRTFIAVRMQKSSTAITINSNNRKEIHKFEHSASIRGVERVI